MRSFFFGFLVIGVLFTAIATIASAGDAKTEAIKKTANKSKAHGEWSPSK
jgi:hypothetical protein